MNLDMNSSRELSVVKSIEFLATNHGRRCWQEMAWMAWKAWKAWPAWRSSWKMPKAEQLTKEIIYFE